MKRYLYDADILLPKTEFDYGKYSVIACDQYTSEPKYWQHVAEITAEGPSAIHIILPEVYLSNRDDSYIQRINRTMDRYLEDVLLEHPAKMMYVERTLPSCGRIRRGIVGCIDLEDYDYRKGSRCAIRATEGTVLERIPPRVRIRENAALETPHVMLFCDDVEKTVIEPLDAKKHEFKPAYEFDLMCEGGHIRGFFISDEGKRGISDAIDALADIDAFNRKYSVKEETPFVFAVGDGNHSLAAAKASYEALCERYGAEARGMKGRYALVELVNIHDEAIEFEPIYRLLDNCTPQTLLAELEKRCDVRHEKTDGCFEYEYRSEKKKGVFYINNPSSALPVGELQRLLDDIMSENKQITIDYIHGRGTLEKLAKKQGTTGLMFRGMKKEELFPSVLRDGALPRKTFSMGGADDKRFYLEGRRIR